MSIYRRFLALGLGALIATAQAKVPPEQMARLDKDLTPLGSERGANKDGSIPNGGWTKI